MAVGIKKDKVFTTWEVPLVGYGDDEWGDNTWIVEHLRQLANKIEEEEPRIYSVGMDFDCNYKTPQIILKVFEKKKND